MEMHANYSMTAKWMEGESLFFCNQKVNFAVILGRDYSSDPMQTLVPHYFRCTGFGQYYKVNYFLFNNSSVIIIVKTTIFHWPLPMYHAHADIIESIGRYYSVIFQNWNNYLHIDELLKCLLTDKKLVSACRDHKTQGKCIESNGESFIVHWWHYVLLLARIIASNIPRDLDELIWWLASVPSH